jgi:hypothetical protein
VMFSEAVRLCFQEAGLTVHKDRRTSFDLAPPVSVGTTRSFAHVLRQSWSCLSPPSYLHSTSGRQAL